MTDPANPSLVSTFGQGDVFDGEYAFSDATIVGGRLVVSSDYIINGLITKLLVYSLSNPAAPTLVGDTTLNYYAGHDLIGNSTGSAVYVVTGGGYYDPTTLAILQRYGDLVAVDLSNPTMPALTSACTRTRASRRGVIWPSRAARY